MKKISDQQQIVIRRVAVDEKCTTGKPIPVATPKVAKSPIGCGMGFDGSHGSTMTRQSRHHRSGVVGDAIKKRGGIIAEPMEIVSYE